MSGVIYISGLDHLDQPITEYISKHIVPGLNFEIIDFHNYYPNLGRNLDKIIDKDFLGLLEKKASEARGAELKNLRQLRKNLRKCHSYSSALRTYKSKLIEILEEKNPDYILTASDHCLTLDLIKETDFSNKVTIIQPALISHLTPTIRQIVRNFSRKTLNKFFSAPIYDIGYNWGDRKFNCRYLLWSKLELHDHFHEFGIIGDLMMEKNSHIKFRNMDEMESILVILPNFSVERVDITAEFVSTLHQVTEYFQNTTFIFKWHPMDIKREFFSTIPRGIDFDQTPKLEEQRYDYVISSLSAFAVNLRRQTSRLVIYHPGKYGNIDVPYFSEEYIKHCKNADEIIVEINGNKLAGIDAFNSLFACDEPTRQFLSDFVSVN